MLCIYASHPLRLLVCVQALTTIGDAAQARANAAPATASGRKLAQLPAANDPQQACTALRLQVRDSLGTGCQTG